jgi:hypothetical protein
VVDFLADFGAREALPCADKPDAGADSNSSTCWSPASPTWAPPSTCRRSANGSPPAWWTTATPTPPTSTPTSAQPRRALAALRDAGRGLIDDVARETALWPAFHLPPVAAAAHPPGQPARTHRRDEAKVGRNDPCPCGSGRKYKKCHGAT